MLKQIILGCTLFLCTYLSFANDVLNLYVGEVKIMKVGNIDRIAVGNASLLSTSMLNNGQLLLIAEGAGDTNVHIWFNNGKEQDITIHISEQYGSLEEQMWEVEDLLEDVDGLNVRIVGERIVLSGKIDKTYEAAITTVQAAFENVMDLTQKLDPGENDVLELPTNKMVLMNIKVTEFNKNFLKNLGIQWDTSITGPAGAFALDGAVNTRFRATPRPTPSFNDALSTTDDATGSLFNVTSPLGYFGIATELTSRINFAVDSGNAVILAEPRLATRSGGEAKFLAGGEFPIEISNINGTTIEFKEFGIKLNISPEVDKKNNIRASVMTEVSSIDNSVAVNNVPGLLTRRTETQISMRSEETLVMSGLIQQEISKDIDKVAFLGDIPIIGELFKSKNFRDRKTELVIFVTPTVFDADSDVNKEAIEYARKGIENAIKKIDEKSIDIVY